MADDTIDPAVTNKISESMGEQSKPVAAKGEGDTAPIYKMLGDTKIPVSKFEGPMWQARRDMGLKVIEGCIVAWNEAEQYYSNTQMDHRKATGGAQSGNDQMGKNRGKRFSHTENIVYSTVNAVIPATYAKNPNCEITMFDDALEPLGVVLEHLGNRLAGMKFAPGINLKPKMTKSILRCEITNEAWTVVGYTLKEFSADQAREDIQRIGKELVDATDQKTIRELEGQLMALEESVDLLDPAGPWVRSLRSEQVVVDPSSTEDDFSDANWKMYWTMLPTNYLNAKFRQKNTEGQYVSQYQASHVADAGDSGTVDATQREIDSFKMLKTDSTYANYGYKDEKSFNRAQMTKVWYGFDRIKRRFYMYADNDWAWPIWVYDDPYHLPNFYPLHRLSFHTDPSAVRTKGEVSHYLDQQDTINAINDEMHRARVNVRSKVLFDSNIHTQQSVEAFMNDGNQKALGVKVPEGADMTKSIFAPPLPAFQYKELWDKGPYYEAANKISGVGAVLQGAQFKTNTTNKAVEEYSSVSSGRIDAKIDAVEDYVGGIMYDVLFLCIQFMPAEVVGPIVGQKAMAELDEMGGWVNKAAADIRTQFACTVEGGSTQKPTSAAKKQEAMQIGQILGQFAGSAPQATIIAMKVMERAFDGIVMTEEDWDDLINSVQMAQQAQMNPGANGAPGGGQQGGPDPNALIAEAVKRGVPQAIAEAQIKQKLAGGQAQPTQQSQTH